jgi:hypothetical protein
MHVVLNTMLLLITRSAAYKQGSEDECEWMDEGNRVALEQACVDLDAKKKELEKVVESMSREQAGKLQHMKELAEEMQALKLAKTPGKASPPSPAVRQALQIVNATIEKYGNDSPEAKMAWEELEEIASSGNSNAIGKRLDEECLVESAMETCLALEELNRVLNLEKSRGEGGLNS